MVSALGSRETELKGQDNDTGVALEKFKILKSVIKQLEELHSKWEKPFIGDQTKIDALYALKEILKPLLDSTASNASINGELKQMPDEIVKIRSLLENLNPFKPGVNQSDTIIALAYSVIRANKINLLILTQDEKRKIIEYVEISERGIDIDYPNKFIFPRVEESLKISEQQPAEILEKALATLFDIACNKMTEDDIAANKNEERRDTSVDNAFIKECIQIRDLLLNILENIDVILENIDDESDSNKKLTGQIRTKLGFLEKLLEIRGSTPDSSLETKS